MGDKKGNKTVQTLICMYREGKHYYYKQVGVLGEDSDIIVIKSKIPSVFKPGVMFSIECFRGGGSFEWNGNSIKLLGHIKGNDNDCGVDVPMLMRWQAEHETRTEAEQMEKACRKDPNNLHVSNTCFVLRQQYQSLSSTKQRAVFLQRVIHNILG